MPCALSLPPLVRLMAATAIAAGLCVGAAAAGDVAEPAQSSPEAGARAQRLDQLFASLKTTKVEEEGEAIVAEIWKLWQQSGDAQLDALMQQAILLMGHGIPALALPVLDDMVARAPHWAEAWNKR